jgi:2-phosphosulfolactate phosphatase
VIAHLPGTAEPDEDPDDDAEERLAGGHGLEAENDGDDDAAGDGRRPQGHGACFEWGATGAHALSGMSAVVVVVDVLSFTTTVAIAVSMGGEVFPCADDTIGRRLAETNGAELAVGRHETDPDHPWSLSPAGVAAAPAAARLVIASPNGSAISAAVADTGTPVIAASLRNVTAVVSWLLDRHFGTAARPVAVVASGERWADGSLRPAIEDLFASGLVLGGLAAAGVELSPEATVAARSVAGLAPAQLADLVRASTSGNELRVAGYGDDVEMAVEIDADKVVPVVTTPGGAFADAGAGGELR